jgi:hypothetical protein
MREIIREWQTSRTFVDRAADCERQALADRLRRAEPEHNYV